MKKFFIILCVLLLIPLAAFAAPSPTLKTKSIWCEPVMDFEIQEDFPELELEDYTLLEVLYVVVDKPYEQVIWHLLVEIQPEDDIQVAIVGDTEPVFQQAKVTEDCGIIVDFTDYEPNAYLLYFFKKNI